MTVHALIASGLALLTIGLWLGCRELLFGRCASCERLLNDDCDAPPLCWRCDLTRRGIGMGLTGEWVERR